ncbi:transcriptional regulator, LacI family protein [Minicystis rosea]|nr:transcriptional regulator, LacI family protein [Minicystis rosea]
MIGLLVDWLEDNYQNTVVSGVADAARELGVDLVCFTGGVLRARAAQRNSAYDLAGPANVDGLLVMSGTLANTVGPDALARFCERYRPLPLCSIAVALPGVPSVLVDNAAGMRELLLHLVEDHGYRRLAFIRGPEANAEAERRFGVFRDVLAEHDLGLDPELVVAGDFQREASAAAVGRLLDERPRAFDVIVAASDPMALGALDALGARGLRVPEDVAVAGFDDVEEARFATPPLTTVRQPLYEQGHRAVETLLAMLAGRDVPLQITLRTELCTRRSCRCARRGARRGAHRETMSLGSGFEVSFAARRATAIAEVSRALHATAPEREHATAEAVVEAFSAELGGGAHGALVAAFEQAWARSFAAGVDPSAWQAAISALRHEAIRSIDASNAELCARAEDLLHDLRDVAAETADAARAQQRLAVERRARDLGSTSEALAANFDVVALARAAVSHLPRLGIESCYLSLYDHTEPHGESARLVLAYDAAREADAAPSGLVFPARQLAPRGALPERRATFVLAPLCFDDDQLGFVLLEMGPREGTIYEALREQLSAALKGAILVREVVEKDRERQRLLDALEKRARELEEANRAIRENQEKLLTSEKLASLGRLTASIVHEMNTPLAAVRAALVDLGKLVDEYQQSVSDPEVTVADHREIAEEMRRAIELASSASARAALFVRGIKSRTRDMGPHERRSFDAVTAVREALLLLGHALRKGNCRVRFEPPAPRIEIDGSPVRFGQVVTNLVENAADASLPRGGGVITVELDPQRDALVLRVRDAGTGIDPEILPRIFEPMFTTKPFGQGTGLGLAIVHDVVTADFGGTIDVESRLGVGTTITIRFPR